VQSKHRKTLVVVGLLGGIGVLSLIATQFFVFTFVKTATGSMANTILPGDRLIVKRRFFGQINRGDIIVFRYSDDPTRYLARVIGLPEETIQVRQTRIFINQIELPEERVLVKQEDFIGDLSEESSSEELEESSTEGQGPYRVFYYAEHERLHHTPYGSEPFKIPAEHYFVMGDNRDNSADSRYRGPVKFGAVIGKVQTIYFSVRSKASEDSESVRWDRVFKQPK
jgi:signal peptidase I